MRVLLPPLASTPLPPPPAPMRSLAGETMGTCWSLKCVLPPLLEVPAVEAAVQRELARVIAQMSGWEPQSALCRFNRAPAGSWQVLEPEFFEVLAHAVALAEDSDGAFDPTLGALVDLWGFGPAGAPAQYPGDADIARESRRCGWHRLRIDASRRAALQPGGLCLDLSGIAKGYAVDLLARRLDALGVANYLVEIGGELTARGVKCDGTPWWVGFELPPDADRMPRSPAPLRAGLSGWAAATSGDYRRFFLDGTTRRSHTLDAHSGAPVASDVASVTVLHRSCMQADALATALMVMGAQAGRQWAEARDVAARFVLRVPEGHAEWLSPALATMLD